MEAPPGVYIPRDGVIDPNVRPSECNLYVNSLPKEITDDKLVLIFGTFGDIESARVMVDRATGISKGYGFVKFRNGDSARNAVQAMNGVMLGSNTLTVKPANESAIAQMPSNNIYIKNLPVTVSSDQLRQECSKFGIVTELRILADFATGISRGQALVRFDQVQSASAAIEHLDNRPFPIHGNVKNLIVRYAVSEQEKAEKPKVKRAPGLRASPYQMSPSATHAAAYASSPYAQYYSPYAAAAPPTHAAHAHAAHAAHGQQYAFSYPGQDPTPAPSPYAAAGQYSAPHAQRQPAIPGTYPPTAEPGQDPNIYVYPLPPETDDSLIYQRFGKYGGIQSVKIAKDPNTHQCKGYAFIRYATMEAAIAAIENENGQRVGAKVLAVSLAKQKGAF